MDKINSKDKCMKTHLGVYWEHTARLFTSCVHWLSMVLFTDKKLFAKSASHAYTYKIIKNGMF